MREKQPAAEAPPTGADDADLLRAAFADVRPLHIDVVDLRPPAPKPIPAQSRRDQRAVLEEMLLLDPGQGEMETGEELLFRRNGVQDAVIRKLRRGQISVQDHLDLHGLTATEAKQALSLFLMECWHRGLRCVRIVHGKGLSSPGKIPVLKPRVNHWLAQRDEVLAFVSTPPRDGGTGAIYVLLKARA